MNGGAQWRPVLVSLTLLMASCGTATSPTTASTVPVTSTMTPASTVPLTTSTTSTTIAPVVAPACPDAAADPVRRLAAGLNTAGFDLWRRQAGGGNLVFSPASIGHTLVMIRGAADDSTREGIEDLLCLQPGGEADEAWRDLGTALSAAAAAGDEVVVAFADRIWPRVGLIPDPAWVEVLAESHGTSVETLDLGGDPEGSRQVINAWVAEHTEGLIADLLPPGVIGANTALVMTDAVYFAAPWAFRFGKYGVIDGMFTRLDGTTVPVELMRHLETVGQRGRGEGFLAAELPYLGDEFSMLLILPDEGEYQAVRQRLDQTLLDVIDATFEEGRYELLMPKWDYDSSLDLIGWLAEQGVAPGHYPGIGPGVWLDEAVHAADVSVNEWGTVAAAATGFVTDMSGVTPPSFVLRLDRPFLYLLRHSDSGLVLFAGQVTDPTT